MEVLLLTVLQLELHTAELFKIEPDIRLFHSDLQYPCGKAFPRPAVLGSSFFGVLSYQGFKF